MRSFFTASHYIERGQKKVYLTPTSTPLSRANTTENFQLRSAHVVCSTRLNISITPRFPSNQDFHQTTFSSHQDFHPEKNMKSAQQIFWSSIAILVLLIHLVDAAGTSSAGGELPKIHRRVRRLTGYRTVCVPKKKKFCSMFTYEGVTEMFCIYVDINRCSALD